MVRRERGQNAREREGEERDAARAAFSRHPVASYPPDSTQKLFPSGSKSTRFGTPFSRASSEPEVTFEPVGRRSESGGGKYCRRSSISWTFKQRGVSQRRLNAEV
ncbi:uncharacterized protein LOC143179572 [Calliopsis andreniformis]|uniref:uncharacterized protein LOC143179572 n=1 Tax=Calliopsis andreniformis TaxID=337506 RepID=UPI003FCCFB03